MFSEPKVEKKTNTKINKKKIPQEIERLCPIVEKMGTKIMM